MNRRLLAVSLPVALAVVTFGAGCGGATKAVTAPPATSTTESTARSTGDSAADRRIAQKALLTIDDFPAGWVQFAEDETPASKDRCGLDRYTSASADAVSFQRDVVIANSWAMVARTEVDAKAAFSRLRATMLNCMRPDPPVSSSPKRGKARLERLSVDSLGDESMGLSTTIPFEVDGIVEDTVSRIVFTRSGRLITSTAVFSPSNSANDELLRTLAKITARRLAGTHAQGE